MEVLGETDAEGLTDGDTEALGETEVDGLTDGEAEDPAAVYVA